MKILNIPIEPLPSRYSMQWDHWFKTTFEEKKLSFQTIYGDHATGEIKSGAFLDVVNTNEYKTSQLQKIIQILSTYDNSEPLVLFFHDLWFPGLLNIAYIRDGLGLSNLKIVGCLHAGSYDPNDFLARKGMGVWAQFFEMGLGKIVDEIFVATYYHKSILSTVVPSPKITVTGFPIFANIDVDDLPSFDEKRKKKIVVFPHRLDYEKRPDLFDRVANIFKGRDWEFVKSVEVCKSKSDYYELLAKSTIALSFAQQETWGIAMQEAVINYCLPLSPNRLSYTEMYDKDFLYDDFDSMLKRLKDMMYTPENFSEQLIRQRNELLKEGYNAIPSMIKRIEAITS